MTSSRQHWRRFFLNSSAKALVPELRHKSPHDGRQSCGVEAEPRLGCGPQHNSNPDRSRRLRTCLGLVLRPEIAALSMPVSSLLVAFNALLLSRLKLPA